MSVHEFHIRRRGEGGAETTEAILPGDGPSTACAAEHPILLSALTDHLTRGDVFLDVGANAGYFALPIASIVRDKGRVLAFEPAPDLADQLRQTARAEGLEPWLTVYGSALGNEDGSIGLHADPKHPEDSTKRSVVIRGGPLVAEVPVRSFDRLVASREVDLSTGLQAVKIDVEGAELEVLSGMRGTLERERPRMVVVETIDTHLDRAGSTVADIHAFMRALEYVPMIDPRLKLNTIFLPA